MLISDPLLLQIISRPVQVSFFGQISRGVGRDFGAAVDVVAAFGVSST